MYRITENQRGFCTFFTLHKTNTMQQNQAFEPLKHIKNVQTGQSTLTHHNVHDVYDGIFNTQSGKKINILHPDSDTITIEDIASALSKICRFGGHTKSFYSVAQHSVLVAALAPDYLKKEALLHDAAEAYLGDVIKPLKVMLPEYAVIEQKFEEVIAEKFGIYYSYEAKKQIKYFDKQALELEHEAFQKNNTLPLQLVMDTYDLSVGENLGWNDIVAKCFFLQHYNEIFGIKKS